MKSFLYARSLGLPLYSLFFLATLFAQSFAEVPASTFILPGGRNSDLTVSVNIPSDATKNEVFFHVLGPPRQSWLAWGFGAQMKDALMFIAYPSDDGSNITVSPRIGGGNFEPKFTSAVQVEVLDGTILDQQSYTIKMKCTGCRTWPLSSGERGTVDVKSTAQSMIYGIGDQQHLASNDQSATLRQHIAYGTFTIDLLSATGDGGVPAVATVQSGVDHGQTSGQNLMASITHGVLMGACFVVLFPIGALLIRLPFRFAFWVHLGWQICTLIGVLVGFSLGIYITVNRNDKPNFKSGHQGLGFAVVILVLSLPILGAFHHRTYKRANSPTIIGKIHKYLAVVTICLGMINGALGVSLANNDGKLPAYFAFVIFMFVAVTLASWFIQRKGRSVKAMNSAAAKNFREGGGPVPSHCGGDVPLQKFSVDTRPVHFNTSQQSFARAEHAPPTYVNVMPKHEGQRTS